MVKFSRLKAQKLKFSLSSVLCSNGSVKVAFRVVVKVDNKDRDPKVQAKIVANTLKEKAKSGKVGNLRVKPTVELKGAFLQDCDIKQLFQSTRTYRTEPGTASNPNLCSKVPTIH